MESYPFPALETGASAAEVPRFERRDTQPGTREPHGRALPVLVPALLHGIPPERSAIRRSAVMEPRARAQGRVRPFVPSPSSGGAASGRPPTPGGQRVGRGPRCQRSPKIPPARSPKNPPLLRLSWSCLGLVAGPVEPVGGAAVGAVQGAVGNAASGVFHSSGRIHRPCRALQGEGGGAGLSGAV